MDQPDATADAAASPRRAVQQAAALTWAVSAGLGMALRLVSLGAPSCAGCRVVPVERRGGTCSPACFNRV